jgi:hypothetical protein
LVILHVDIPWLLDLNTDSFEVKNMFDNPKYAEVREQLPNNILAAIPNDNISETNSTFWDKPYRH